MMGLDILLLILLSIVIVYSIILNKRILEIEKYRMDMRKLLREFDDSIIKSANSLADIKTITGSSEAKIKYTLDATSKITKELDYLVARADKLSDELEMIIVSGNRLFARISESISDFNKAQASLQDNKTLDRDTIVNDPTESYYIQPEQNIHHKKVG
ncbi:MAG: hypothetical protein SFT68_04805 [Rickettsiaceae bacterium]|nr:hypothetical protein [Rickettsiaceae bacterium]